MKWKHYHESQLKITRIIYAKITKINELNLQFIVIIVNKLSIESTQIIVNHCQSSPINHLYFETFIIVVLFDLSLGS